MRISDWSSNVCSSDLAVLEGAPPPQALEAAIAANPDDLEARHLLGVHHIVAGDAEAGFEQFLEMLRRNRDFEDALPKKALIDAFRWVEDEDLVGRYRRRLSSLMPVCQPSRRSGPSSSRAKRGICHVPGPRSAGRRG